MLALTAATVCFALAIGRGAQAETSKDLQVERAAHDETAEKMVQLQQRLEVTLQELANLERFTKRQQTVAAPPDTAPHVERLLKEESYLKSRLLFVQQVRGYAYPVQPLWTLLTGVALLMCRAPPFAGACGRARCQA